MCNSNKAGLDFMDISEFDREPDWNVYLSNSVKVSPYTGSVLNTSVIFVNLSNDILFYITNLLTSLL